MGNRQIGSNSEVLATSEDNIGTIISKTGNNGSVSLKDRKTITSFGIVPKLNSTSQHEWQTSTCSNRWFPGYSPCSSTRSSGLLKSSLSCDLAPHTGFRTEGRSTLGTERTCPLKRNTLVPSSKDTFQDASDLSFRLSQFEKVTSADSVTPVLEINEKTGSERAISDVLVTQVKIKTVPDENSIDTKPSEVRRRGKAIQVKTVDRPGGKFLNGKEFWLQNNKGEWENVTIENWNPWNGTWQVRGAGGTAFPAAPIALKSEEEYGFLSRDRSIKSRSFKSLAESETV